MPCTILSHEKPGICPILGFSSVPEPPASESKGAVQPLGAKHECVPEKYKTLRQQAADCLGSGDSHAALALWNQAMDALIQARPPWWDFIQEDIDPAWFLVPLKLISRRSTPNYSVQSIFQNHYKGASHFKKKLFPLLEKEPSLILGSPTTVGMLESPEFDVTLSDKLLFSFSYSGLCSPRMFDKKQKPGLDKDNDEGGESEPDDQDDQDDSNQDHKHIKTSTPVDLPCSQCHLHRADFISWMEGFVIVEAYDYLDVYRACEQKREESKEQKQPFIKWFKPLLSAIRRSLLAFRILLIRWIYTRNQKEKPLQLLVPIPSPLPLPQQIPNSNVVQPSPAPTRNESFQSFLTITTSLCQTYLTHYADMKYIFHVGPDYDLPLQLSSASIESDSERTLWKRKLGPTKPYDRMDLLTLRI